MNITPHIFEEAKALLSSQGTDLEFPVQLDSAKEFFLTKSEDETVLAFSAFEFEGLEYKIGVRRI